MRCPLIQNALRTGYSTLLKTQDHDGAKMLSQKVWVKKQDDLHKSLTNDPVGLSHEPDSRTILWGWFGHHNHE